jgi:hypothetical protein
MLFSKGRIMTGDPQFPTPEAQRSNRRHAERYFSDLTGTAMQAALEMPCRVLDLSVGGARLAFEQDVDQSIDGRQIQLEIDGFGRFQARLRWIDPRHAGLSFDLDADAQTALMDQISAALSEEF